MLMRRRQKFLDTKIQALTSPPISETNVPDSYQPMLSRAPEGHLHVPAIVCNHFIKPHIGSTYTFTG